MFMVQQNPGAHEAAYRKGYAKGLAASEPSRMIRVNLSGLPAFPGKPQAPRYISLNMRQDTPIRDVLAEIHPRLPEMQHPFTITTVGKKPQVLTAETDSVIMELLEPWDAAHLPLRVQIHAPEPVKGPKRTLGSRIRSALKGDDEQMKNSESSSSAAPSSPTRAESWSATAQSAPPPYEEAIRSKP